MHPLLVVVSFPKDEFAGKVTTKKNKVGAYRPKHKLEFMCFIFQAALYHIWHTHIHLIFETAQVHEHNMPQWATQSTKTHFLTNNIIWFQSLVKCIMLLLNILFSGKVCFGNPLFGYYLHFASWCKRLHYRRHFGIYVGVNLGIFWDTSSYKI